MTTPPLVPLKPLHPRATPRARKPAGSLPGMWGKAEKPLSAAPPDAGQVVRENLTAILLQFTQGESFDEIGRRLPTPLSGMQIRVSLQNDKELRARYVAAQDHRAHGLFELAGHSARKAFDSGDYGKAADIAMKVAGVMSPKVYGPKAEISVSGALTLEGEVTVKMSPEEAYQALVNGHG